jgi:hypothetical protein
MDRIYSNATFVLIWVGESVQQNIKQLVGGVVVTSGDIAENLGLLYIPWSRVYSRTSRWSTHRSSPR